jgi:hypothetical protein
VEASAGFNFAFWAETIFLFWGMGFGALAASLGSPDCKMLDTLCRVRKKPGNLMHVDVA